MHMKKPEQPKLLPGKGSIIQITEGPISQPPKIVTHSKIIFQESVIQKLFYHKYQ